MFIVFKIIFSCNLILILKKKIDKSLSKKQKNAETAENIDKDISIETIEEENESFNESLSDNILDYERINSFYLYKKYIKEIFVRMKQFKDELLASCLEFILSLPIELIVENLDEAFYSLQVHEESKLYF